MIEPRDLEQLNKKGISEAYVEEQVKIFRRGFPYAKLAAPATIGNGIFAPEEKQINDYVEKYIEETGRFSVMKFVPASGAATRMFKDAYEWRERLENNMSSNELFEKDENARKFFNSIKDFAFWNDLISVMNLEGYDAYKCLKEFDYLIILEFLLDRKGLNYGNLPKGLLKFHSYDEESRTPFEEHLVEGALYGSDNKSVVNIHFTVSPEHIELFHNLLVNVVGKYEELYKVKYSITFSIQNPSTDTLAVDPENNPFRENTGDLLFRPGGHGALIHNLNSIDKDLIFIKNIDNVVPDSLKNPTVRYKKMLGGILLGLQQDIFRFQKLLESEDFSKKCCEYAVKFACESLNFDKILFNTDFEKKKEVLSKIFNAPIRVCGMVKNEGEPGGGPFWVFDSNQSKSLQIVESSQINIDDNDQTNIFNKSTHFNPVDIVCGIKNYKGEKYDLKKFIDKDTGFISEKSKDGRPLKALELPGLWNGAMARWITVFVQVPIITFNPVKTINDLLRDEHQ